MKLVAIKYSGRKPYTDKTALKTEWTPGDTKLVPDRDVKTLLRFAEFKLGDEKEADASQGEAAMAVAMQESKEQDEHNQVESMLHTLETMDKDALESYAAHYQVDLDKRRSVEKLRAEVANLIEQFGVR